MSEQIEYNKIQQLNNLNGFMDKYRIVKQNGVRMTHNSMGSYLGAFDIPDDKLVHFFKFYKKAVKAGNVLSLLEAHTEQGPIVIDIDMKYKLSSNVECVRIYQDEDIINILKIYNQVILTYLAINPEDLNIYVMEKQEPKILCVDEATNETTYKDGIHIMYPHICASNKLQFFFRELVVNELVKDKTLDHLNIGKIDDVIDKAVIERSNWLLYGSCKDNRPETLYRLTRLYDSDMMLVDLEEVDIFNLPQLLSIRKFKPEEHSEFAEGMTMEKIEVIFNELLGKKNGARPYAQNDDIRKAQILVGMFSEKRAKDYRAWLDVGFCLHNIDESLIDIWIEFSKKSPAQFKQGECEKIWKKFKYEGLRIGSLFRWAKEDNPGAYSDFMLSECDQLIKNSLNCESYPVAKLFYEFNKYQYVCTSIDKKKWYEFIGHRWTHMDSASGIINKLNIELANDYIKLGAAFGLKASVAEADEIKRSFINKSKMAYNISQKLHQMSFKKTVIDELLHLYHDSHFMEKLDENRYLIGFENGVYDLENHIFRNGRPEDYISMTTKCDYIDYNLNDEKIKEVIRFFNSIQPDQEMCTYLLTKLSSFLEGTQRDQRFEIWTGTGANGKGRILKLILDSFGEYACTIPVTLLTRPRLDANSASPALSQTKGKRMCAFQEPEPDDKIYVGHMKNIVGGDKMMARSLYADPVEFYPQFKTILACNKLPDIPASDYGTWRRIRVVPFEMSFVKNPTQPNEKKMIDNLDDMLETWQSAFMSILIETYKNYRKFGLNEPDKILLKTNEYQNATDIFNEFIKDKILTTDKTSFVSFEDLVTHFKTWYKDSNYIESKKPHKNDLKFEMEHRLCHISNNKFYGFKFRENEDEEPSCSVTVHGKISARATEKYGDSTSTHDFPSQEVQLNTITEESSTSKIKKIFKQDPKDIDGGMNTGDESFEKLEKLFIKSK